MTTKVTIRLESPNHQDAMVEVFNPVDGTIYPAGRRVAIGESVDFWVHQGSALRVTEVAPVKTPE
jgi:hypothetical protein